MKPRRIRNWFSRKKAVLRNTVHIATAVSVMATAGASGQQISTAFRNPLKTKTAESDSLRQNTESKKSSVLTVKPKKTSPEEVKADIKECLEKISKKPEISNEMRKYSLQRNLDSNFVLAVIIKESSGNGKLNFIGGKGLMGITGIAIKEAKRNGIKTTNVFDVNQNINVGTFLLSYYSEKLQKQTFTRKGRKMHFSELDKYTKTGILYTAYKEGINWVLRDKRIERVITLHAKRFVEIYRHIEGGQ
jgi:uncharacterized FlaG/YvyC family protein